MKAKASPKAAQLTIQVTRADGTIEPPITVCGGGALLRLRRALLFIKSALSSALGLAPQTPAAGADH